MYNLDKNKVKKLLIEYFNNRYKQIKENNNRKIFISNSKSRRAKLVKSSNITRKNAKRNLLDNQIFIPKQHKEKFHKSHSIYDYNIETINLNDYSILKSIAESKNIPISEFEKNREYTTYDIYFLLRLNGETINLFPSEYKVLFDKYLYKTIIDTIEYNENILNYLILPRLFTYNIGHLKSYFILCVDSSDNNLLSILYNSLKKINIDISICTKTQFNEYFMYNNNIKKEEIIYLLLSILSEYHTSDITIIDYYRLNYSTYDLHNQDQE